MPNILRTGLFYARCWIAGCCSFAAVAGYGALEDSRYPLPYRNGVYLFIISVSEWVYFKGFNAAYTIEDRDRDSPMCRDDLDGQFQRRYPAKHTESIKILPHETRSESSNQQRHNIDPRIKCRHA